MVEPRSDSAQGRDDMQRDDREPRINMAMELASNLKIVRFADLARCGDEIWIELEGQLYRLRKTRQGKLILTK
jgi:hemin uptake protein HemP